MPKYKLVFSVVSYYDAVIEAANEEAARKLVEEEGIRPLDMELYYNDFDTAELEEVEELG